MKTSDQYFNDKIAKIQSIYCGLIIATPAFVIVVIEVLAKVI